MRGEKKGGESAGKYGGYIGHVNLTDINSVSLAKIQNIGHALIFQLYQRFLCKKNGSVTINDNHLVNAECALYVGQTRRHIHTRISEHMGVSPLIGKKRSVSTSYPYH
jgi:hypothetical protein